MIIGLVSTEASSLIAADKNADISIAPIESSSIAEYGDATDGGIELQIKPIQSYSAKSDPYTMSGLTYYPQWHNYDIWLSNKSGSTFCVDRVEYGAFNNGQPVSYFSVIYQAGSPVESYLNANTFFIISYNGIIDSIPPQNILYFNCAPVYKVDNIHWERDHILPNNAILSLLYPRDQYFGNVSVPNRIVVTISGTEQGGARHTLATEFSPTVYTDSNLYNLPLGIPEELPSTSRWKVLEGSTLNASHRRAGVWAAKDDVFYMSNLTRFALDFVIVDAAGNQFRTDTSDSYKEDYYCWDQPVYAVESGTVLWIENDQPDHDPINPPSPSPSGPPLANGIIIDHGNDVMSYYYHMKQLSIDLVPGDQVVKGEEIGRVGSSGTNIPHLHYHLMKDPSHYVAGNTNWTVLPEGLPTEFNDFYIFNGSSKSYIKKGCINSGAVIEQNVPLISISLEGPEWTINDISLGGDRYSTVDGTRYGVPMHTIVNEGNVDVKVVMSYAGWEGISPSYNDLIDHFQTSAALESGHLITIQPPDSPYPQAVIRNPLKTGSRSPLSLHYTAPSSLTKPTTQTRAYYEIRAYATEGAQVK